MAYFYGVIFLALLWCPFQAEHTKVSPVARVSELLESLAKKAEKDGKKDWEIYETYVCWAKAVIDEKTASNAAANSKIEELTTFIADIEAGRVEFTTERQELTKELGDINADMEAAKTLRDKEHKEFLAAKDEMSKGIAALDKSLKVLKEAIDGHRKGTFLLQRDQSELEEGFAETLEDAASLHHAVELSKNMLSAGDAVFLKHLLTGTAPKPDWKKLNRKATFKMSYKARSLKIESVLQKMLATFSANLKEAEKKEAKAKDEYDDLMEAKKNLKEETEDQLKKGSAENGAKGLNKEEAQTELDALTEQVTNDKKFIKQTTKSLEETKAAYKDRQALREAEIKALNKAVSILHSDDARSLFRKSFKSQGYEFLQTSQKVNAVQQHQAAGVLRKALRSVADPRLISLISRVEAPVASHFTEVLKAIDTMITDLKKEQEKDFKTSQTCQDDRAKDTRAAVKASRNADEKVDSIAKLETEIVDIEKTIKEKNETIAEIEKDMAKATENRNDENIEFLAEKKDDEDAIQVIKSAKAVLTNFYKENGLMFVQLAKPRIVAGKAPPPPPATWDAPYGGKTEETTSILAMIDMIVTDIEDDISKEKASEDRAQKEFDTMISESKDQIKGLNTDITALTDTKAQKADKVVTLKDEKGDLKTEITKLMKTITDADPGCEYFMTNFKLRTKNRDIEMDGLYKAKTLLKGGEFDDDSRELKPGDAFLQVRGN